LRGFLKVPRLVGRDRGGGIRTRDLRVTSQTFERLVRRAGIRVIRLHDLRHTHATLALKAGVPVKVIGERLGHESPAFTLKQYAHVIPGMHAAAAAVVADLIREHTAADRDAALLD
jgi:integrase